MYKNMSYAVMLMLLSAAVNAEGWSGYRDVLRVGVRSDSASGFYFVLSEMKNPDGCGMADHYFVGSSNPMMREMFSLVLAAKKSGSKIDAKISGCDNGRPKAIFVVD